MRPDSIDIALVVHVLGAMVLVGALLTSSAMAIIGWNDEEPTLGRLSYKTLLFVGLPGFRFHALTLDAWKRELATVDKLFTSMRVGDAPASAATRPAPAPAQGASGLYLATVRRMVFRATGGSEWTTSTEFYLLSTDGKVYRGHGLPEVPGGNLARFDYEKARRADPGNSGTYTEKGSRVTITVGDERIDAALSGQGELEIRGTKFRRSLK